MASVRTAFGSLTRSGSAARWNSPDNSPANPQDWCASRGGMTAGTQCRCAVGWSWDLDEQRCTPDGDVYDSSDYDDYAANDYAANDYADEALKPPVWKSEGCQGVGPGACPRGYSFATKISDKKKTWYCCPNDKQFTYYDKQGHSRCVNPADARKYVDSGDVKGAFWARQQCSYVTKAPAPATQAPSLDPVVLYADTDFRGDSLEIHDMYQFVDLWAKGFNDKTSSIKVPAGKQVWVYWDTKSKDDPHNQKTNLPAGNYPSLKDSGFGSPAGKNCAGGYRCWNDQISAIFVCDDKSCDKPAA